MATPNDLDQNILGRETYAVVKIDPRVTKSSIKNRDTLALFEKCLNEKYAYDDLNREINEESSSLQMILTSLLILNLAGLVFSIIFGMDFQGEDALRIAAFGFNTFSYLEGIIALMRKRSLAFRIFILLLFAVLFASSGVIADAIMNFGDLDLIILSCIALLNFGFFVAKIASLSKFKEKMHIFSELERNYQKAYESDE